MRVLLNGVEGDADCVGVLLSGRFCEAYRPRRQMRGAIQRRLNTQPPLVVLSTTS